MKPKILLTRKLPDACLEPLHQFFDVTMNPHDRVMTKSEILKEITNKDALLCLLTDNIDKDILNAAPQLKVISNYAVGFNNIDVAEATRRHIPVCITPGVLTETTADLTFALMLAVSRRIVEGDHYLRAQAFKGWGPTMLLGSDVFGKTLGIIGMGRIGEAVCKRALGFNMKVLYTSRTPKNIAGASFVLLTELLKTADFISLHLPFSNEVCHLIGEKEFNLMKPTAFFINTARGAIVDEKALVKALQEKRIAGAGLDVYEHEPELAQGLTKLENTVLLPHIGSATTETRTQMGMMAVENAIRVLKGENPWAVANK